MPTPPIAYPPWTCDFCGFPIETVEGGWLDWVETPLPLMGSIQPYKSHSLRIVHHKSHSLHRRGCYHDRDEWFRRDRSLTAGVHLDRFLGTDGLMRLLEQLADNRFDSLEVIEIIKRLHIPGYEQARLSFDVAISDGAFEPNTRPGFYRQEEIEATLQWLKCQRAEDQ